MLRSCLRVHVLGGLAGVVALAVLTGAPTAGAGTAVGRFGTLPAGQSLGLSIRGTALLHRGQGGTTGRVVVLGLEPGRTYAAHLHNAPCSFPGNPGGGHYRNDPAGVGTPPNELWFSSTANPLAGLTADRAGVGRGAGSAQWVAGPAAQSVVIHHIPAGGTTAGGPKIACADLG